MSRADAGFDTLGPLDAQLWYWDTPETPMNMGNVCVWEGEPLRDGTGAFRLDDVRRVIASRVHLIPRYRRRMHHFPMSLVHPVLVDDPEFDITQHVELMTLPAPGTIDQLKAAFAQVHEGRLESSRALWKIVFVDGLEDGRIGMIQKIHHTPFDGATTVQIMRALFDEHADERAIGEPPSWDPRPVPSRFAMVAATLKAQARVGWRLTTGPDSPWLRPWRMHKLLRAAVALRHFGPAPPTSLNRPVGPRRRFDWLSTSIAEVKRLRGLVPGSKLNDVMLAAVAGGLRELFLARGEDLDTIRPRVFVPVDARDPDSTAQDGNRVSAMVAVLPIHEPDALRRLRAIADQMEALKAGFQSAAISAATDISQFAPAAFLKAAGPQLANTGLFMNLTVTNVPGPPRPLFLLGARMLELNPMLPLGNRLALNVAVESYAGDLSVGVCCDPDAVPDLDVFTNGIAAALRELRERVDAQDATSTTSRSASRA